MADQEQDVVYTEVTCNYQIRPMRLNSMAKVEIPGWGSISFPTERADDGEEFIHVKYVEGLRAEHGDELADWLLEHMKAVLRNPEET